jgi:hypothetical protein
VVDVEALVLQDVVSEMRTGPTVSRPRLTVAPVEEVPDPEVDPEVPVQYLPELFRLIPQVMWGHHRMSLVERVPTVNSYVNIRQELQTYLAQAVPEEVT